MTTIEEILMDVHKQMGANSALLQVMHADIKETKKEAKNTNGRVSRLELREEARDDKVMELAGALLQLQQDVGGSKKGGIVLDWQKVTLFLGSIATILALAIERLWK